MVNAGTVIETSKAINTDWFSSDVTRVFNIPGPKPEVHTLQISVSTTTVVNVILKNTAGNDTISLGSLTAATLYQFTLILQEGDTYNIQHATGTQNVNCRAVASDKPVI